MSNRRYGSGSTSNGVSGRIAFGAVGVIAVLAIIISTIWYFGSTERVQAGYGCAITHHGRYDETVGPGRYFEPSWGTGFTCYETRAQNAEVGEHEGDADYSRSEVSTQTRDGRTVYLRAKFRFAIPLESIEPIYSSGARSSDQVWSRFISDEVVYAIQEVVNVTDINTVYLDGRAATSAQIQENLAERLGKWNITLETFQLTNVDPPDDYEEAVANQQQQQENTELELARAETIRVTNENDLLEQQGANAVALSAAENEAEVNHTISESLTPELVQLAYYEALQSAQWVMLSPGDVQPTLPIEPPVATPETTPEG